jgi:endonuclease/exonuclease/phosphatase family metal-dependent hydrolase
LLISADEILLGFYLLAQLLYFYWAAVPDGFQIPPHRQAVTLPAIHPQKLTSMKIATWNIERLIKRKEIEVVETITSINADIIVLTETSARINLSNIYKYHWHTKELTQEKVFEEGFYKADENRVTIWSKFPGYREIETFNNFTSICQEIETSLGNIIIYGTIIGIEGNRNKSFLPDLKCQLKDFNRLSQELNLCIIGDLNITFGDGEYFTKEGRTLLVDNFNKNKLINLTADVPKNIDHIILSRLLLEQKSINWLIWNGNKILSDHIGVMIEIN